MTVDVDQPDPDVAPAADDRLEVRGRLVRPVATLWALAGAALLVGEVVRLFDVGELGWQLLAGVAAVVLAWRLWAAGCVLDPHGIEMTDVRGHRRVLWSALDAVEVDVATRLGVPVRLRRRDGSLVAVDGTWGMPRAQRDDVVERVRRWTEPHRVEVRVIRPS